MTVHGVLAAVARGAVDAGVVLAVAAGEGPKGVKWAVGSRGVCRPELRWSTTPGGIEVERPVQRRVSWRTLHDLVAGGLTDDLTAQVRRRYRLYVEVQMEPCTWWAHATDRVHRARLDAHRARYWRIADALDVSVRRVVTRGLDASDPQLALDLGSKR